MRLALLTTLVLALAGCGQKGALYFDTAEPQAPAQVPADNRDAETATADDNEQEAGDTPTP